MRWLRSFVATKNVIPLHAYVDLTINRGDTVYVAGYVGDVLVGIGKLTFYSAVHPNGTLTLVNANRQLNVEARLRQITKAEYETFLEFDPGTLHLEPRFNLKASKIRRRYMIDLLLPLKRDYVKLL